MGISGTGIFNLFLTAILSSNEILLEAWKIKQIKEELLQGLLIRGLVCWAPHAPPPRPPWALPRNSQGFIECCLKTRNPGDILKISLWIIQNWEHKMLLVTDSRSRWTLTKIYSHQYKVKKQTQTELLQSGLHWEVKCFLSCKVFKHIPDNLSVKKS